VVLAHRALNHPVQIHRPVADQVVVLTKVVPKAAERQAEAAVADGPAVLVEAEAVSAADSADSAVVAEPADYLVLR